MTGKPIKKFSYVLFNERPGSGLLNSQLFPLVKKIADGCDVEVIHFLQPHIYLKNFGAVKLERNKLELAGVCVKVIPLCPPERLFLKSRLAVVVYAIWGALCLYTVINRGNVCIGRGYPSSFALTVLKLIKNIRYIFDPRSQFVEESVSLGRWTVNSVCYNFWKKIEKYILNRSDLTIVIHRRMEAYYQRIKKNGNYLVVPLISTNTMVHKRQASLNPRELSFVYVGSLENRGWNNFHVYFDFMENVLTHCGNASITFITKSNTDQIYSEAKKRGIQIEIVSLQQNEVTEFISSFDFGLQLMEGALDAETRYGVKAVEYFAVGLPIITNYHVGALAEVVLERGLGLVIDGFQVHSDELALIAAKIDDIRGNCYRYFRETHESEGVRSNYAKAIHRFFT